MDGGDCNDCKDLVEDFERVGDGVCDWDNYNLEECNNNGGDCSACNRVYVNFRKLVCNGTENCTLEYGDCNECIKQVKLLDGVSEKNIGDYQCDKSILDIKEYVFDGGDCFNRI